MSETLPSDQDRFGNIDDVFKALDEQRSEALRKLRDLQANKSRVLEKEHERLTDKFGSDHPRVTKIAARLAFNKGIQKDLESLIARTDIEAWGHDYDMATDDTARSHEPDAGAPTGTPDIWTVKGEVVDGTGVGVGGLIVSLFDKDMLFDDILGSTITDKEGCFRIWYRTAAFCDLFEAKPDLYLNVTDDQGNLLYTSEHAVRYEAGRVETLKITIERRSDGSDGEEAPDNGKDD